MYRPISSHGDSGDAVKFGDFVAIPGSKGFVVSVEEGGHLKLKGCRHRFLQGFGATQSYARADRRASRPLPLVARLGLSVMSASLIGRLRSSTFRLSATAVSMSLTGSRFSSESAPGPFHHGIRGRSRTIFCAALSSV